MSSDLIKKEFRLITPPHTKDYSTEAVRLMYGELNIKISKKIKKAIKNELDSINFYPPITQAMLRNKLAAYNNLKPGQIMIGNGSDALIELIAKAFIEKGDEVVIPSPSFPTYENVAKAFGANIIEVNLGKDFSLDVDSLIKKITKRTKLVFIANPNNPTGNLLVNKEEVEKILKNHAGILVIDECYYEFADFTVKELISANPNLLILRSLSKTFGLAGLRVGYCIGQEELIKKLNAIQSIPQPFHVDRLSLAGAAAALDLKEKILGEFEKNKQCFVDMLKNVAGIEVLPTKTSFIIIKLKNKTGKELQEQLSKHNIFIKRCGVYKNFGEQYAYLGIPFKKDIKKVIEKIKEGLK